MSYEDSGIKFSPDDLSATATPNNSTSRKRKVIDSQNARSAFTAFGGTNFLSSTMNESITNELERFNLDSFASNYYVERSDITETPTSAQPPLSIEPSTPAKSFCSSPMKKLGSPERNEILYPSLHRTGSYRLNFGECSKRFSPAKKRLFEQRLRDPLYFFWNSKNCVPAVVNKILSYLCDEDLFTCSRVSRKWKSAIVADPKLKERLHRFTQNKVMNKENYVSKMSDVYWRSFKQSFDVSPVMDSTQKLYEITNSLREGQHLEKCLQCYEPAVVERNISQCTRSLCGFIRCIKCNSLSTTGPQDFTDKCQQSYLLVGERSRSKFSLMSSPTRGSEIPSFLLDDSYNSPTLNTSGYETDLTSSSSYSKSRRSSSGKCSGVLQNYNSNAVPTRTSLDRSNTIVPVVPMNARKIVEVIEPSSPPKVKDIVACSKKSKRNLKRLRF